MLILTVAFHAATLVGIFYLISISINFIKMLLHCLIGGYALEATNGSYALITGSSAGLGREFALQLAKKGYNIIAIARSLDKLDTLAIEIRSMGRACLVIPFDFRTRDSNLYEELQRKISGLKIEVLVNNVGLSHSMPTSFLDEDWNIIENILDVNIYAMLKVSRMVLVGMCRNQKGIVLNIGSMAGKVPSGLLATYAASKSFVSSWSQGVAMEVKCKKVHVEHINAYFIQTEMSKIRKPSILVPTPKDFVKSVLKTCGKSINSTPYWSHALLDFFSGFLNEKMLITQSLKLHRDIRRRALAKQERLSKEN